MTAGVQEDSPHLRPTPDTQTQVGEGKKTKKNRQTHMREMNWGDKKGIKTQGPK